LSANAQAPVDAITYSDNFVTANYVELPKKVEFLYPPLWVHDSCVNYFKWRTGIEGKLGNASEIIPNTQFARIGYGMLFSTHLSYIENIVDSRAVISETNWVSGKFTIREISLDDPSIRGYYKARIF
jgi:hypothetical protein